MASLALTVLKPSHAIDLLPAGYRYRKELEVQLLQVNRRQRGTRYDSSKLIVGSEVREYDSPKLIRGRKPNVPIKIPFVFNLCVKGKPNVPIKIPFIFNFCKTGKPNVPIKIPFVFNLGKTGKPNVPIKIPFIFNLCQ